jgi:hypothetical protein
MSYTTASIVIHAEKFDTEIDPRYRVYLDNRIIVERVYWADHNENAVVENITFKDDDQQHTLEVCSVFEGLGAFSVNNVSFTDSDTKQILEISHTLDQNTVTFETARR